MNLFLLTGRVLAKDILLGTFTIHVPSYTCEPYELTLHATYAVITDIVVNDDVLVRGCISETNYTPQLTAEYVTRVEPE